MTYQSITLSGDQLTANENVLLSGLENASLIPDPLGVGAFLRLSAAEPSDRIRFSLGRLEGIARWTACYRYEPFWMYPKAGIAAAEIPVETQFLLCERPDGSVVMLVPLVDEPFRSSLEGGADGRLTVRAETGDPGTVGAATVGLFIASGPDPYTLAQAGARSVASYFNKGRLRCDKPVPGWVDHFGWCTWDAFYQDVSEEKLRAGLESFADAGVTPRLLILDDGWQSVKELATGEKRLSAFAPNEKFGGDLRSVVHLAKENFGVTTFLVWHAIAGYWGGVDAEELPGYEVTYQKRQTSPGVLSHTAEIDQWWGPTVGLVSPNAIDRFYHDYHRGLRSQGVDGVKVDTQAVLETVAAGAGSRVMLMRRYHEALEGSVHVHFQGNLINCMSCANEMLYHAAASTVTRTSTDFWPNKPESHGLHLFTNAQVCVWFGEWVQPDWDMFQSAHAMGSYHAAGRVVGGSPLYVSDKPEAHDFDLLRKLVLPGGEILRADGPGRPTRQCLFHDPTKEDVLLTIFNTVRSGAAGLIGAFHAKHRDGTAEQSAITGSIGPSDVVGMAGEAFVVYAHKSGATRRMGRSDRWELSLSSLDWELFTVVPVTDGFAPIGLANMMNSAGAITHHTTSGSFAHDIGLRAGGRFIGWCAERPRRVLINDEPASYSYEGASGRLEVAVAGEANCRLTVEFG